MTGIYVIKNISDNKCYIGSSNNISKRKSQHLDSLRKNKHSNSHLQNAFNISGEDKFVFHVLEDVEHVDDLIAAEDWWINNIPRNELYNFRLDAITNRGIKFSDEARKNMSLAQSGKKHSEETKQKRADSIRGRKVTQETRDKIGAANKGKQPKAANEVTKKSVLQIDQITNLVIKAWDSMGAVERELGINHSTVSKVCNGKSKSAGGYYWRFQSGE